MVTKAWNNIQSQNKDSMINTFSSVRIHFAKIKTGIYNEY